MCVRWLLVLGLGGCWRDASQLDQVVWSDDDRALLLVELRFDERGGGVGSGTTRKRAFRHQLFLADPDGSGAAPVGVEIAGQNVAEVYLMQDAGYAITGALDEDARVTWSRTTLRDGAIRALDPWPDGDPGAWVPSPDGAFLARIRSDGSGVAFFAYDTLQRTGGSDLGVPPPADWTWRPDGVFVVTDGSVAEGIQPQGTSPVAVEVPGCTSPKTTSSPVSSDGTFVFPGPDGTVGSSGPDPEAAFGCQ